MQLVFLDRNWALGSAGSAQGRKALMSIPAMLHSVSAHAQLARPAGDCQPLAVPLNPVGRLSVGVLLNVVCPSTVVRGVPFRVINAIKGMLRWACSHVNIEVWKLTPAIRDDQAFGSVAFKEHVIWVRAALQHARPNAVFAAFIETMFGGSLKDRFPLRAPARDGSASFEVIPSHLARVPAETLTQPPLDAMACIPRRLRHLFHDGQASKHAARQVNDRSSHTGHSIMFFKCFTGACEDVPVTQ